MVFVLRVGSEFFPSSWRFQSFFHRIEWQPDQSCSEAYLGCSQTSVMELFPEKLINGFQLLTIFTKSSIIDVWQGSKYTSSASISFFYIIKDWPMNFTDIALFKLEVFPLNSFDQSFLFSVGKQKRHIRGLDIFLLVFFVFFFLFFTIWQLIMWKRTAFHWCFACNFYLRLQ